MKEHKAYTVKADGVTYVHCDKVPDGVEVVKENVFYTPDEGMVFTKDGELFDSVFVRDESVKIEDYVEIKDPRPAEEPQPEEQVA